MFCPTCGKENSHERKFCPSCGTNLERVTKALSSGGNKLLAQADQAFEKLLAQYAGLFFKSAPEKAAERSVTNSWQIFGQFFLALLANFILIPVCFVALKLRFFTLFFSTPFRLLAERSEQRAKTAELLLPQQDYWLMNPAPSATDHTTVNLVAHPVTERKTTKE
jgi:hypothetical protein